MKSPKQMNFLIVDDMDNMRRSIRAMLRLINFGHEFFEAGNGQDALKILEKSQPGDIDFIISDWNMPRMNGTELLHQVRLNRKLRDIPFLMITAEANMEVVAEAAEHDVDAYMTKPFVTVTLEHKVKELLDKAAHPDPTSQHLRNSRLLEEKGELDAAIMEAKNATAASPQSSRPMRELGRLLLKKGDHKASLHCFLKATENNRLDVTSYHYLGQIYYNLGDIEKAIEYYAKAININPRHSERAFKFANMLLEQNKTKEAEKVLRLVLRYNQQNLDLKEDIAELCTNHGLDDLGVKTIREILSIDPERSHLNKKLGLSLIHKGQNSEAVRILEKAAESASNDISLLLVLSRAYLDMKMLVRADKWATRVIRIDPKNQEAKEILDKCM